MTTMEVLTSAEINQIADEVAGDGLKFKVTFYPWPDFRVFPVRGEDWVELDISPVYQFMSREQMRETLDFYYSRLGRVSLEEGRKASDELFDMEVVPSVLNEFKQYVRGNEIALNCWIDSIDGIHTNAYDCWLSIIATECDNPEIRNVIVVRPHHGDGWLHGIKDMLTLVVPDDSVAGMDFEAFKRHVLKLF